MSDLRDKIARALHRHSTDDGEVHILWGGVEENEAEVAEWLPYADAVLAVLDDVRAEAWEKGFDACEDDIHHHREQGWDAECIKAAENPYRKATSEQRVHADD